MKPVEVITIGGASRVVEADGSPAMNGRNPSDGGGLPDLAAAAKLADTINARRERRGLLDTPDQPAALPAEPAAPQPEPEAPLAPEQPIPEATASNEIAEPVADETLPVEPEAPAAAAVEQTEMERD